MTRETADEGVVFELIVVAAFGARDGITIVSGELAAGEVPDLGTSLAVSVEGRTRLVRVAGIVSVHYRAPPPPTRRDLALSGITAADLPQGARLVARTPDVNGA